MDNFYIEQFMSFVYSYSTGEPVRNIIITLFLALSWYMFLKASANVIKKKKAKHRLEIENLTRESTISALKESGIIKEKYTETIPSVIQPSVKNEEEAILTSLHGPKISYQEESLSVQDTENNSNLYQRKFGEVENFSSVLRRRSWKNETDSEIVRKIASLYGFDFEIQETKELQEQVLQLNQTDFAFIKSRAKVYGYECYFEERHINLSFEEPKLIVHFHEKNWNPKDEYLKQLVLDKKNSEKVQEDLNFHKNSMEVIVSELKEEHDKKLKSQKNNFDMDYKLCRVEINKLLDEVASLKQATANTKKINKNDFVTETKSNAKTFAYSFDMSKKSKNKKAKKRNR